MCVCVMFARLPPFFAGFGVAAAAAAFMLREDITKSYELLTKQVRECEIMHRVCLSDIDERHAQRERERARARRADKVYEYICMQVLTEE